jgi:type VI secretion system protein ImpH
MGHESNAVNFLLQLAQAPHRYDFYQTMRRLECVYSAHPRWGHAQRPIDEPARLGQDPDLSFAPTSIASFTPGAAGKPGRLQVRLLGLLGPNGPLPLFFTEYARDRLHNANDPTLSRFLDVVQHRFLALFYRAWAQAQPHVNRDRPSEDRFAHYVAALIGLASPALRDRDAVPDLAKLFHAGRLMPQTRHPDGLASLLGDYFGVPVRLESFIGHWLVLGVSERTYLNRPGASLGVGGVLGGSAWDRQSKFRIHLGALDLAQYESFLPGGTRLQQLVAWVRSYRCFDLDWDVRLRLQKEEVPALRLGSQGRLGWTTWLGERCADTDAEDLCLAAEAFVNRRSEAA